MEKQKSETMKHETYLFKIVKSTLHFCKAYKCYTSLQQLETSTLFLKQNKITKSRYKAIQCFDERLQLFLNSLSFIRHIRARLLSTLSLQ